MSEKIGVLIAAPDEAAAILANPVYRWQKDKNNLYYSANLVLAVCGIGKASAAFALGQMFAEVSSVIMLGTAGGTAREKIGSLWLYTEFVEYDMDATGLGIPAGITPYSGMTSPVIACASPAAEQKIKDICRKENLPLNTGRVMSGDRFISNAADIKTLAENFGAQLVDMESAAAAKICLLRKKPFCAVRYVTDSADASAAQNWRENVRLAADCFDKILWQLCA